MRRPTRIDIVSSCRVHRKHERGRARDQGPHPGVHTRVDRTCRGRSDASLRDSTRVSTACLCTDFSRITSIRDPRSITGRAEFLALQTSDPLVEELN